jgi:membrane protein implicated in regulation of membrane protease activity
MIFKRFTLLLIVRLGLVGAAMTLLVWLLLQEGLHSATLLVAVMLLLLIGELWRFVSRTNREVARFLDAAR